MRFPSTAFAHVSRVVLGGLKTIVQCSNSNYLHLASARSASTACLGAVDSHPGSPRRGWAEARPGGAHLGKPLRKWKHSWNKRMRNKRYKYKYKWGTGGAHLGKPSWGNANESIDETSGWEIRKNCRDLPSLEQSLEMEGWGRRRRRNRWKWKSWRRGKPVFIFCSTASFSEKYLLQETHAH